MSHPAWNIDWRAARAQAPEQGASLLRHAANELRCERVALSGGLAVCQVEGRCGQALSFEAPGANEPRAHLQFLARGRCDLLDNEADHPIAAHTPTLFNPPPGQVAWRTGHSGHSGHSGRTGRTGRIAGIGPSEAFGEHLHVISIDVTATALRHWCDSAQAHALLFERRRAPPALAGDGLRLPFGRLLAWLAAQQVRGPTWRMQCEGLVLQALADSLDRLGLASSEAGVGVGAADLRRLRRARELLADDPAPPVTLLALAQAVAMPLRRLQRLYHATYGTPLREAVQQARFEAARRALLGGGLSIKQVAWQAGFAHPTSFTHAFRAHFGVAPSALTSRRAPRGGAAAPPQS